MSHDTFHALLFGAVSSVIVLVLDHTVNPQPAIAFAQALGAKVVKLTSDSGHLATGDEDAKVTSAVKGAVG